jgi:hypothetical protein
MGGFVPVRSNRDPIESATLAVTMSRLNEEVQHAV